tara:strand:- start:120 stop:329 length:210 start_codon:yes stop_codon:yes gene_type:complete
MIYNYFKEQLETEEMIDAKIRMLRTIDGVIRAYNDKVFNSIDSIKLIEQIIDGTFEYDWEKDQYDAWSN